MASSFSTNKMGRFTVNSEVKNNLPGTIKRFEETFSEDSVTTISSVIVMKNRFGN